jgi:hypothetical protein
VLRVARSAESSPNVLGARETTDHPPSKRSLGTTRADDLSDRSIPTVDLDTVSEVREDGCRCAVKGGRAFPSRVAEKLDDRRVIPFVPASLKHRDILNRTTRVKYECQNNRRKLVQIRLRTVVDPDPTEKSKFRPPLWKHHSMRRLESILQRGIGTIDHGPARSGALCNVERIAHSGSGVREFRLGMSWFDLARSVYGLASTVRRVPRERLLARSSTHNRECPEVTELRRMETVDCRGISEGIP